MALVGLAVALITVSVGGSPTASTGTSAAPAAPGAASGATGSGTVPKGTSHVKGQVISAAKLAQKGGAITPSKSKQNQVISWQTGPGGTHLTAVSNDLGSALQAGGVKQYSSMKHACGQLVTSVAAAESGPRIPDTSMQTLYAKALTELAKGAADCQAAISFKPDGDETVKTHVNTGVLQKSMSELSAGAKDVFRSTAEIAIITRQHH